jgi:hypothetical protein
MEIRGLGIIDVQSIFGIRSIRLKKRVEVEVDLRVWSDETSYERVGLDEKQTEILGVEGAAGAGSDHAGQEHHRHRRGDRAPLPREGYGGYSPAEKLNQHMLEVMKRKSAAPGWVREDIE